MRSLRAGTTFIPSFRVYTVSLCSRVWWRRCCLSSRKNLLLPATDVRLMRACVRVCMDVSLSAKTTLLGRPFFCLLCCCVRVLPDERACARAYSAKVGRGPELGGNQRPATHLRAPVRELAETSLEQEVEKHWEVLMLI